MSKELTPLEALKQFRNSQYQGVNVYADELLDIIETALKEYDDMLFEIKALENTIKGLEEQIDEKDKSLKALEIIKKCCLLGSYPCGIYELAFTTKIDITKEEYELLKEVLL